MTPAGSATLDAQAEPGGPSAFWQRCVATGFACLGFFLSFSTAGTALSSAALLLLLLRHPVRAWRSAPWRQPVMAVGLVLFAYILLHTLWLTGTAAPGMHALNQYHELVLAPLLLALLGVADPRSRLLLFRGFVAGCVAVAVVHWVALASPAIAERLMSRRISVSFALSLCAFLCVAGARTAGLRWIGLLLATTVIFATEGRTGQVVLLLLAAIAAWQLSPPRWRWIAAVLAVLLLAALATQSRPVEGRLKETLARSQPVGPDGPSTSTGIRIELLRLALDLVPQHGLAGAGYASYPQVHEAAAQRRYADDPQRRSYLRATWIRASNPHNEYFSQLIGGGVVALLLFLAWLGAALHQARRAGGTTGTLLAGACAAFAVGCLFNSMLLNFAEGHLYTTLLAWMLAPPASGVPSSSWNGDRAPCVA